jgi:hypothetical protein
LTNRLQFTSAEAAQQGHAAGRPKAAGG